MFDNLTKKKNVMILTVCMVTSFVFYQLYFFLAITSEMSDSRVVPMLDHDTVNKLKHSYSEHDKFINNNGIIRGVFYSQMPQYRPSNNEFKCLKTDVRILFEQVNDDYCDCEDGSDEPSTNACPEGVFHCDTQPQRRPLKLHSVPSSKVNDGICDCCDGSDEWILMPDHRLLSQKTKKQDRQYVLLCPNVCSD